MANEPQKNALRSRSHKHLHVNQLRINSYTELYGNHLPNEMTLILMRYDLIDFFHFLCEYYILTEITMHYRTYWRYFVSCVICNIANHTNKLHRVLNNYKRLTKFELRSDK